MTHNHKIPAEVRQNGRRWQGAHTASCPLAPAGKQKVSWGTAGTGFVTLSSLFRNSNATKKICFISYGWKNSAC